MAIKVVVTEKEILSITNDDALGSWVRKEFWRLFEEKSYENEVKYDECLVCGKQSPYSITTNINDRVGYVEGAGQTCFMPKECNRFKL